MLTTVNTVPINSEKKELVRRGEVGFPCSAYIGDVHHYVGDEISLHWHDELEIFMLDEGMIQVIFADQAVILQPGEGYFVNSNVLHGIVCDTDQPCRYRSIVFDQAIVSGYRGSIFDVKYVSPFISQGAQFWALKLNQFASREIRTLFGEAFLACESELEGYEFIVREIMSKVVMILSDSHIKSASRIETVYEQRLKKMLYWIEEHYMERVTVEDIADAAGICVRECQRMFSTVLHDTPIRYLMRRRIVIAAGILRCSNASMCEICEQCGFESQSYFTKQFRLIMGETPKQYQNKSYNNFLD